MFRETGFCPFTGKTDQSLASMIHGVDSDVMELAHIVSESLSEGIKGVSEEARQEVGPLPQTILHMNYTELVSAFRSLTGQRPLGLSLNTLAGSSPALY